MSFLLRLAELMDAPFQVQRPLTRRPLQSVMSHSRVGKALLILLGILPAAFLLADIYFFAVNVPFMDDWQFVPLLEKAKEGTLSFQDLWAPHDEHRLLLPRIIIVASMFASGGDYRVQCFITFSVVAIISACLLWLMVRLNSNRYSVLEETVRNWPEAMVFHFRGNQGQAAALFFGMKHAEGEILVTLDGDGQNDFGRHSQTSQRADRL